MSQATARALRHRRGPDDGGPGRVHAEDAPLPPRTVLRTTKRTLETPCTP